MIRRTFLNRLRPFVALLLGIAIIPVVAAPSFAQGKGQRVEKQFSKGTVGKGERVEKTFHKRMSVTGFPDPFSFPRKYVVYTPRDYNREEKLPLVMVLHGCLEQGSTPPLPFPLPLPLPPFIETIEFDTKFDEVADQERFIVVYPNHGLAANSLPFCWMWWVDANTHEGHGEVGDLANIVKEVQRDYKVDPNRIHIAGLSSGACMTVDALVAYSEIFASGSPTAGVPYSETSEHVLAKPPAYKSVDDVAAAMTAEMGSQKRPVPIFIIHSKDDQTVPIQYGKNIRDSWGKAFGVDTQQPSSSSSGTTKGTPWTHDKYRGPDGNTVVETLFVEGLKHGWYGDGEGQYAFPNAPDTTRLAWEFFKAHPRPTAASAGGENTPR